jgi:hypothetical protein
MRIILTLWAVPLCLFWSWYALSFYDISFGTIFFSRGLHDLVFEVYGNALGVPPGEVPVMAAWACTIDTALIGAIAAFRWRAGWYPQLRTWLEGQAAAFSVSQTASHEDHAVGDTASLLIEAGDEPQSVTALPDGRVLPAE